MLTKSERFQLIHDHLNQFKLNLLLQLVEISHSGYYKWLKTVDSSRK